MAGIADNIQSTKNQLLGMHASCPKSADERMFLVTVDLFTKYASAIMKIMKPIQGEDPLIKEIYEWAAGFFVFLEQPVTNQAEMKQKLTTIIAKVKDELPKMLAKIQKLEEKFGTS